MDRPLRRTTLRDEIKDRIVERILDGTYGPGDRIVESQVATEFGTSQAPVREALRELEAMRFVETQPHRGARVREVTSDELIQIYPVRAALEEVAGREAAVRMSDEQLSALADELAGMRQAAEVRISTPNCSTTSASTRSSSKHPATRSWSTSGSRCGSRPAP